MNTSTKFIMESTNAMKFSFFLVLTNEEKKKLVRIKKNRLTEREEKKAKQIVNEIDLIFIHFVQKSRSVGDYLQFAL